MRSNSRSPRWLFASLLVAAWIVTTATLAPPAHAQDGVTGGSPVFARPKKQPPLDPPPTDENISIKTRSFLVTTPVAVIDSSGQFVYNLSEKDFQIFDNGVREKITSFDMDIRPVAAVILIQADKTVAPLEDQVRPLASMISGLLMGKQGLASVVLYNDRVNVAQTFSNDGDKLASTLKVFVARGSGERLNDALERSIELLETRPKDERRVIVAFSDGRDSGSDTTREELIKHATGSEVAIYGLGFNAAQALLKKEPEGPPLSPLDANVTRPLPPGVAHTPSNSAMIYSTSVPVGQIATATGEIIKDATRKSLLEYYAGYTGGVYYGHWSKKTLQENLDQVASEIQSQYELAYVPDTLAQSGFHRIQVQVERRGVRVRARAGYFAPGKTP